jgi:hypothetical protein
LQVQGATKENTTWRYKSKCVNDPAFNVHNLGVDLVLIEHTPEETLASEDLHDSKSEVSPVLHNGMTMNSHAR